MDKIAARGIEVSARELVVALTGHAGVVRLQRFANTAAGHKALLRTLTRGGEAGASGDGGDRVVWARPGTTVERAGS